MKAAADRTARSASARGGFTDADYGTGSAGSIQARLAALDWKAIEESLWRFGYAKAGPVLTPAECAELIATYADAGSSMVATDSEGGAGIVTSGDAHEPRRAG